MRRQIGFAVASYVALAPVSAQAVEFASVSALISASIPYFAEAEIANLDESAATTFAPHYRPSTVYDSPAATLAADFGGPIMLPDLTANTDQDEGAVAASTDGASDFVALDNILFLDIPEPSTWAMLIAGLGLLGVGLRRSHRTSIQFS